MKYLAKSLIIIAYFCLSACEQPTNQQNNDILNQSDAVSIKVAKVELRDMKRFLHVYGTVLPTPASQSNVNGGEAILTSPSSGLVKNVFFSEGQWVKQGDIIAVLDDTIAKANVKNAKADLEYASKTISQDKALFAKHNNSQQQINLDKKQLAQAQANLTVAEQLLANLQITSPIDGIISKISVTAGLSIDLNLEIARIINPKRLELEVELPSQHVSQVKVGQKVFLVSTAENEQSKQAKRSTLQSAFAEISFINPLINSLNGTQLLRLTMKNNHSTSVGQLLPLKILLEEHKQVLSVPKSSLYVSSTGEATLSTISDFHSKSKVVKLGIQNKTYSEIIGSTLQPGQLIATQGSYFLPDNSQVEYTPIDSSNR